MRTITGRFGILVAMRLCMTINGMRPNNLDNGTEKRLYRARLLECYRIATGKWSIPAHLSMVTLGGRYAFDETREYIPGTGKILAGSELQQCLENEFLSLPQYVSIEKDLTIFLDNESVSGPCLIKGYFHRVFSAELAKDASLIHLDLTSTFGSPIFDDSMAALYAHVRPGTVVAVNPIIKSRPIEIYMRGRKDYHGFTDPDGSRMTAAIKRDFGSDSVISCDNPYYSRTIGPGCKTSLMCPIFFQVPKDWKRVEWRRATEQKSSSRSKTSKTASSSKRAKITTFDDAVSALKAARNR